MTSDCVVDVELFKKYSTGSSECDSCSKRSQCESSYIEICKCIIKKHDKDEFTIFECVCLKDFFEHVRTGECVIHYNDSIKKEYLDIFDKLPADLKEKIFDVLSNEKCTKKIKRGKLKKHDFELIDDDPTLKYKKHYLDVATHLDSRRIISTQEAKDDVYNHEFLINLTYVISCVNVCDQNGKILDNIKAERTSKEDVKRN